MTDPFTGAALGGVAVVEGIKFLYGQAGEVLKRWRERHDDGSGQIEAARLRPPDGLLNGTVEPLEPRDDYVDRLEAELRQTRRMLADYAEGLDVPSADDGAVVQQADALRRLLEVIYGQQITFRGEKRPHSGPIVIGDIDVERVAGEAAAVRAKAIEGGEIRGSATAKTVEPGGKLSGVEADRIT